MKMKLFKVTVLAGLMSVTSQVSEGLLPHSNASAAMIQEIIRVCRQTADNILGGTRAGDVFEIGIRYGDEGAEAICRCTREWLEEAGAQAAQGTVTNSAGQTVQCIIIR